MHLMKLICLAMFAVGATAIAQVQNFKPVTEEMLKNPSPNDWLMFSRTYDAQRFSPLKQIDKSNVSKLSLAWTRGLPAGNTEGTPVVHDGVMYLVAPGGDRTSCECDEWRHLWEYKRPVAAGVASQARTKTIAIYQDVIFIHCSDGFVVGLDARTGEKRWETLAGEAAQTSGPIVVNGKVISGRACARTRESCFIAAHDALTGKELWKFYTVPGPGEPGYESWNNPKPETHAKNMASTWGLPGSYDPQRNLVLWGVANAMPNTRMDRHDGNPDGTSRSSPSDLYSNSTLALNPDTGKLVWYYQHLPGDDWDEDYTNERILTRIKFNPDTKFVKWFNPNIKRGEERDVSVMIGEGGGIFVNDRGTGEFLWAIQFPFETPRFLISNIDGATGKTYINYDLVMKAPGDNHLICFFNTTSYWPSAYHPGQNSIYVPYVDNCLDETAKGPAGAVSGASARPGRRATRRSSRESRK